jgi:DNA-binding IclR family transcriptional regulator
MVQSIERAFTVLRALARGPAGVTQIADEVDLPKSTVARLLSTLEAQGAVEQRSAGGEYRLGGGLIELAAGVAPGRHLVAAARPYLEVLVRATGEAAGLSVADGYDAHYLAQVETPNPVQVRDWTGERAPLHTVSSGLVILAHWPGAALADYLGRPLVRLTPRTEIDPGMLRERLAAVRAEGHAWTAEEFAAGITSVAAPVRDGSGAVVAALHIHGPSYRFPAGEGGAATAAVVEAAAGLSRRLGGA